MQTSSWLEIYLFIFFTHRIGIIKHLYMQNVCICTFWYLARYHRITTIFLLKYAHMSKYTSIHKCQKKNVSIGLSSREKCSIRFIKNIPQQYCYRRIIQIKRIQFGNKMICIRGQCQLYDLFIVPHKYM